MFLIVYLCIRQIRLLIQLKRNYFRKFWSYIDLGIIVCSCSAIGSYIVQFREANRISDLFQRTNGFAYVNLQRSAYINDLQSAFLAFSCFFSCINVLRLGQYHRGLRLFTDTLRHASKDLLSFAAMFSVVFMAFLSLFYFIFVSTLESCSTLLQTSRMLFEMSLMKFDTHGLVDVHPFLGPLSFTLFIFFVVFICMSMFITIVSESFRAVRDNMELQARDDRHLLSYLFRKCQHTLGLRGRRQSDLFLEYDQRMRSRYLDPVEHFPDKIDQLIAALDRVSIVVLGFVPPMNSLCCVGVREPKTAPGRSSKTIMNFIISPPLDFL